MKYTIKQIMPTGKEDAKYGKEYSAQFNEDERIVKINFKKDPNIGDEVDGEIMTGKYGPYFKRSASGGSFGGGKYDSDGQRQGMCINNAANFVNTIKFKETLTNREWAETVFAYAQSLYNMGDLKQTPAVAQEHPAEESQEVTPEKIESVKELFSK